MGLISKNNNQKITESENEKSSSKYRIDYIKPPRTSSITRHYRSLSRPIVEDFSGSETSYSEQNSEKLFYKYKSLSTNKFSNSLVRLFIFNKRF